MKRRSFIKRGGAGLVGGVAIGTGCNASTSDGPDAANVQAAPNVSWRLASSFSRSLDTIYGAAEVLADRVSAMTDGRFRIRSYPGGELVPAFEVLGAVQNGTVHMGHTASYYYVGKNPALAFDTTVPFGLTARQYNAWMYHGGGLELIREVLADFNITSFLGGNTGTQMGGWFRRPVESLSDLRGVKMRIPGLGGDVMDRLGVSVQLIPGGEIYPALERGAIDATEWVGPYDDEKLGLHQVANNYYYPGWWEPCAGLSFYVNLDAWNKLPATYREILTTAAAEANVNMQASYDAKNPLAFERLRQGGTQIRPFSSDIMTAARANAIDILEQNAGRDPQYRKLLTSMQTFQKSANAWFSTAERAYSNFTFEQSS